VKITVSFFRHHEEVAKVLLDLVCLSFSFSFSVSSCNPRQTR